MTNFENPEKWEIKMKRSPYGLFGCIILSPKDAPIEFYINIGDGYLCEAEAQAAADAVLEFLRRFPVK